MRFSTALFSLLLLVCLHGTALGQTKLNIEQSQKLIAETPDLQILDVRTAKEFAEGHLVWALNLNFYHAKFSELAEAKLDKSRPVLIYASGGGRSRSAANLLTQLGFAKVFNLTDGFKGWKAAGKPYALD